MGSSNTSQSLVSFILRCDGGSVIVTIGATPVPIALLCDRWVCRVARWWSIFPTQSAPMCQIGRSGVTRAPRIAPSGVRTKPALPWFVVSNEQSATDSNLASTNVCFVSNCLVHDTSAKFNVVPCTPPFEVSTVCVPLPSHCIMKCNRFACRSALGNGGVISSSGFCTGCRR